MRWSGQLRNQREECEITHYVKICHENLKCFLLLNLFSTDKKCQPFCNDQEKKEISQMSEREKKIRAGQGKAVLLQGEDL